MKSYVNFGLKFIVMMIIPSGNCWEFSELTKIFDSSNSYMKVCQPALTSCLIIRTSLNLREICKFNIVANVRILDGECNIRFSSFKTGKHLQKGARFLPFAVKKCLKPSQQHDKVCLLTHLGSIDNEPTRLFWLDQNVLLLEGKCSDYEKTCHK